MLQVLSKTKRPMNCSELVAGIRALDLDALGGSSPEKSLYSIIYRRELKRIAQGEKPLFATALNNRNLFYRINK